MALCQSYYMRTKKPPSPLYSRAVRKSIASQHESKLVRQTESCTPCLEVLNIINVCCVCRQQEEDDLLPTDAERKGMVTKEGREFTILRIPLADPSSLWLYC